MTATAIKHALISVDDHVQEPPDLWTARLSKVKWGDRIPHLEKEADGSEHWVVDGQVVEARNPHAGHPFADDDATIAAALEDVCLPALLCSLVHMTGDPSWIRSDLRPRYSTATEFQAGMSAEVQAEVRHRAVSADLRAKARVWVPAALACLNTPPWWRRDS